MKRAADERVESGWGVRHVMAALYLLALGVAMGLAVDFTWRKVRLFPEFAQAGDTFGYLQFAEDVRRGAGPHGVPRFTFDSEHSRLLADFFKGRGVPVEAYSPLLGPNAYHYQAGTGLIVNQYPPGVGLLLSLFPEGHSIHAVSFGIGALLLAGLAAGAVWVLYGRRGAPLALRMAVVGMLCLCCIVGLLLFNTSVSYSVDFFCLAMFVAFLLVHGAMRCGARWGWVVALLGGMAFGFGILSRLATGLFVFGFVVLLWPRKREGVRGIGRVVAFCAGTVLSGIVPLMIHQRALTGSAFRSTYVGDDVGRHSLAFVGSRFMHYTFGEGSTFLPIAVMGMLGFGCMVMAERSETGKGGVLRRHVGAMLVFWGVPTAFLMTHPVATDYYQLPTLQTLLFAAAFGGLVLVREGRAGAQRRSAAWLVAASCLLGGEALLYTAILPDLPPAEQVYRPPLELPEALKDPRAWIVGDRFTGTLWYYHGVPAHAVLRVTPAVRAAMYGFVAARGEPLYVVMDNPVMQPIADELMGMGAQLEPAGSFGEQAVVRVHWAVGRP